MNCDLLSLDKLSDNEFFDAVKSGMQSTVVHVSSKSCYKASGQGKTYVVYVSISFAHVSISFAHVSIFFAHVPALFPGSCGVVPKSLEIRLHVCNIYRLLYILISNHGR